MTLLHQIIKAIAAAVILFLFVFTDDGLAADQIAGQAYAMENCSRFHALGTTDASHSGKAPPFRVVARKYKLEYLQEALAEGIVTGHNMMPEFILTPQQIDNLLAYFETLK